MTDANASVSASAATQSGRQDFLTSCRDCSRLSGFLDDVRQRYPEYYARPVPSFGVNSPAFLIVGLAPGMHGANATGRPFTGDHAGILLYQTLFDYGFASAPVSTAVNDGLSLYDCRITNAVRCLPPENKPLTAEVNQCNVYLRHEIDAVATPGIVLALGGIAHRAVLKARQLKQSEYPFGHGAEHTLSAGLTLIDSYHCSRYNTQTRRLTTPMFQEVFQRVRSRLDDSL